MSLKLLKFLLIISNSLVQISAKSLEIIFQPSQIVLKMGESAGPINMTINYNETDGIERMVLTSSNSLVAGTFDQTSIHQSDGIFQGQFNVTGIFLGNLRGKVKGQVRLNKKEFFFQVEQKSSFTTIEIISKKFQAPTTWKWLCLKKKAQVTCYSISA